MTPGGSPAGNGALKTDPTTRRVMTNANITTRGFMSSNETTLPSCNQVSVLVEGQKAGAHQSPEKSWQPSSQGSDFNKMLGVSEF